MDKFNSHCVFISTVCYRLCIQRKAVRFQAVSYKLICYHAVSQYTCFFIESLISFPWCFITTSIVFIYAQSHKNWPFHQFPQRIPNLYHSVQSMYIMIYCILHFTITLHLSPCCTVGWRYSRALSKYFTGWTAEHNGHNNTLLWCKNCGQSLHVVTCCTKIVYTK